MVRSRSGIHVLVSLSHLASDTVVPGGQCRRRATGRRSSGSGWIMFPQLVVCARQSSGRLARPMSSRAPCIEGRLRLACLCAVRACNRVGILVKTHIPRQSIGGPRKFGVLIAFHCQRIAPLLEPLIVLVAVAQTLLRLPADRARSARIVLPVVTAPTDTLQVLW